MDFYLFKKISLSQQLGSLSYKKNHEISPHYHNPIKRIVSYTRETLIIKSGSVRVDFYVKKQKNIIKI